jgi:hypothetical protein
MKKWLPLVALCGLAVGVGLSGRLPSEAPPAAAADEAPPAVREAECRRATNRIKIDGVIDDVAWDKAQVLQDFSTFWEKRKARSATKARLLWDDQYLYFCAEMEDVDLYADVKEHNGLCWENDVFELFFKPHEDQLGYYEFQVNALNTQLEMFLPSRGAGGYRRFQTVGKLGTESAVKLNGTLNDWTDKDKGWTVEGRIPWKAFAPTGGRPKAGDKWRFALCRYDYSTAYERPDLSSTAPLTLPDFHRYEDYGTLEFKGAE